MKNIGLLTAAAKEQNVIFLSVDAPLDQFTSRLDGAARSSGQTEGRAFKNLGSKAKKASATSMAHSKPSIGSSAIKLENASVKFATARARIFGLRNDQSADFEYRRRVPRQTTVRSWSPLVASPMRRPNKVKASRLH